MFQNQVYRMNVQATMDSEPIALNIQPGMTPLQVGALLQTIFDIPPSSDIVLHETSGEKDDIYLSTAASMTIFSGNYVLTYIPIDLRVPQYYKLINTQKNESVSQMPIEETYKSLIYRQINDLPPYKSNIYKHQFLVLAFTDIAQGVETTFLSTFYTFLLERKNPIFNNEDIISAMIEVISTEIADKVIPNDNFDEVETVAIKNITQFMALLISKGSLMKHLIRPIISAFRPSCLAADLIKFFIFNLQNYFDSAKIFTVVSDLFGDGWLCHCFVNITRARVFLSFDSFHQYFPFVAIRIAIDLILTHKHTIEDGISMIKSTGGNYLMANVRTAKMLAASLMCHIYELIEYICSPCLNLNQQQLTSILRCLEYARPLFALILENNPHQQFQFLSSIVKHISNHTFEPKGLLYHIVSFLSPNKKGPTYILNELAAKWMQKEVDQHHYRDCILVELNSFFFSTLPVSHSVIMEKNTKPKPVSK